MLPEDYATMSAGRKSCYHHRVIVALPVNTALWFDRNA